MHCSSHGRTGCVLCSEPDEIKRFGKWEFVLFEAIDALHCSVTGVGDPISEEREAAIIQALKNRIEVWGPCRDRFQSAMHNLVTATIDEAEYQRGKR